MGKKDVYSNCKHPTRDIILIASFFIHFFFQFGPRSSSQKFYKIVTLKNLAEFTDKYLRWRSKKSKDWPAELIKKDSITRVFP